MPASATADGPTTSPAPESSARKRKPKRGKSKRPTKKAAQSAAKQPRQRKPTPRMLKIFKKRARDYRSDSDPEAEEGNGQKALVGGEEDAPNFRDAHDPKYDGDEEEVSSQEDDDITDDGFDKFADGCRVFKAAFHNIMKAKIPEDSLGPILSAHRKHVAAKLADEVEPPRAKRESRKEKRMADEKGHVVPESFMNEREKQLIKIATKGVVSLFNMVSKAQGSSNPSRGAKSAVNRNPPNSAKQDHAQQSSAPEENYDQPAWAPLQDRYMLSSKLKDWDKMADSTAQAHPVEGTMDSSEEE